MKLLPFKAALVAAAFCAFACSAPAPQPLQTPAFTTRDSAAVQPRMFGIYLPYDETAVAPLPKAPRGYKPCYLTHYGRHGSRYLMNESQYENLHDVLLAAHNDGALTPEGERLYKAYEAVFPAVAGHANELTPIGQLQHKGIATRMMDNYPGLFKGDAQVEVLCTNLERTMLSMFAFCGQLWSANPRLQIHADAPKTLIHTLNPHSVDSRHISPFDLRWRNTTWKPEVDAFRASIIPTDKFLGRMFTSADAVHKFYPLPHEFVMDVYYIAADMPSLDIEQYNFFSFFDTEELKRCAEADNLFYYVAKGPYPAGYLRSSALAFSMLEGLVNDTDADLASGIPVRLRFGHDGCMMAMFCLLGLENWSTSAPDFDRVWDVFNCSGIPMAGNLQYAFWRNGAGDTIVNVRLNERNFSLPLPEVCPGFYRWDDMRALFLEKAQKGREVLNSTPSE